MIERAEPLKIKKGGRGAMAVLLVVSAVLFVVGTRLELSAESGAHASTEAPSGEGQESPQHRTTETNPTGGNPESVFGINPDSTPAVAAAAAFSLLLALAVWFWGNKWVLGSVTVLGLALAALDLREVARQIGKSRTSLTVIAVLIALMHLALSALAGLALRRESSN